MLTLVILSLAITSIDNAIRPGEKCLNKNILEDVGAVVWSYPDYCVIGSHYKVNVELNITDTDGPPTLPLPHPCFFLLSAVKWLFCLQESEIMWQLDSSTSWTIDIFNYRERKRLRPRYWEVWREYWRFWIYWDTGMQNKYHRHQPTSDQTIQ